MIHLNSPTVSKEDLAREIARRDGVTEGLIAVLTCVESCQTFGLRRMGENHYWTRIKHRVEENSLKMYDKQGSVLRIETTINNPERFKIRREVTRKGQLELAWVPMRKSVADIARRVDICRAANERYLEALGVVGESSPTRRLLDPVNRRVTRDGRPYRALRERLFPEGPTNDDARRKASGRVTRFLRLLRAHRLIRKVPGTFYYRITSRGHHVMTTALKLREIDLSKLAA